MQDQAAQRHSLWISRRTRTAFSSSADTSWHGSRGCGLNYRRSFLSPLCVRGPMARVDYDDQLATSVSNDSVHFLLKHLLTIRHRNNATDPSALPLACPQPSSSENSATTDEDCLSMIIFVPAAAALGKTPAMMWYEHLRLEVSVPNSS